MRESQKIAIVAGIYAIYIIFESVVTWLIP